MKLIKEKIILVILCMLLATSIYMAYYFWGKPTTKTYYVVTCRYRQEVNFNPKVKLKPSFLYDNRTYLQPGETAYLNLVDQIEIQLNYRFNCSQPLNSFTLNYTVNSTLEAEGSWRKTFTLTPNKTIDQTAFKETYTLKIEEINELIQKIEKETGIHATKYLYTITPHIQLKASTDEGTINEKYNPTLTITLNMRGMGGHLDFSNLNNTKQESLGHYEHKEVIWSLYGLTSTVRIMQHTSIITTICLSASIALIAGWTLKKPPPPTIEKIKKKYGEKIVESSEPPTKRIEKATIKLKSIEDLYKVSEETIKPIIHEETLLEKEGKRMKRHVFYVLDNDIRYEYATEEATSEKQKREKSTEEKL